MAQMFCPHGEKTSRLEDCPYCILEALETRKYFDENGGVPFDHWGKGCPDDCTLDEHYYRKRK